MTNNSESPPPGSEDLQLAHDWLNEHGWTEENLFEAFRFFKLSPMEQESLLELMYGGPESENEPDAQ
jgi:hypothetical protein